MARELYLELAASGLRMPIGTDLILHEEADVVAVKHDARALGAVVERAAQRFQTPLAFPLMDLSLEKADLLAALGVPAGEIEQYHFSAPPGENLMQEVLSSGRRKFAERISANQGAVRYIAEKTALVPVGMLIGPFSLMTKLVADPIAPVALAASGVTAEEDPDVCTVERCLALAEATVQRSAVAQIEAGARSIIVCEPAANTVYLSPRQLRKGSDIFERFVLAPNERLRKLMVDHNVDLVFHDCGELTGEMVSQFAARLHPAMLSLGSSRNLWEDAALIPEDVVLYGNLPTKMFYSDSVMPLDKVRQLTGELRERMRGSGHPHILGSECDVLHVPEAAETIMGKVNAMLLHVEGAEFS